MRKNICYGLFLIATILVIATTGLSQQNSQDFNHRQTQSSRANEIVNFQDLTFKITTAKENYLKLEPITLNIEMSNDKDYPITGHFYVEFSEPGTKLLIGTTKDNLIDTKRSFSMRTASGKGTNQLINPKQRQTSTQTLDLRLDELFPVEGEYYLQLAVKDFTGTQELFSNIIKIKINEPTGKDLAAYQYIKGFSGNQFSRLSFSKQQAKYFIDNFPDTTYTDQIMFFLADSFFSDKEYQTAIKYFKVLLNKNFPLNNEVLAKLVKANLEMDNQKEAKQYFKVLQSKFPDSQYAKTFGWHKAFDIDGEE